MQNLDVFWRWLLSLWPWKMVACPSILCKAVILCLDMCDVEMAINVIHISPDSIAR